MNAISGFASHDLNFKKYDGREGLAKLRDPWMKFESEVTSLLFYQTYDWYRCLLHYLATDSDKYTFVLASHRDTVVAIFPFQVEVETQGCLKYRVLDLPSHPHMVLRDFALHPSVPGADILSKLVAYLESLSEPGWDVLRFRQVPAGQSDHGACLGRKMEESLNFIGVPLHLPPIVFRCRYLPRYEDQGFYRSTIDREAPFHRTKPGFN